jgi:hypothetical protein
MGPRRRRQASHAAEKQALRGMQRRVSLTLTCQRRQRPPDGSGHPLLGFVPALSARREFGELTAEGFDLPVVAHGEQISQEWRSGFIADNCALSAITAGATGVIVRPRRVESGNYL